MESTKFELNHDPRCSYWVDDICVCQQIAELEEKAEWLGKKDMGTIYDTPWGMVGGLGTSAPFSFYGTFTTTVAPGGLGWTPKYTSGIAEVDERAASRADLYARYDELKKKAGL